MQIIKIEVDFLNHTIKNKDIILRQNDYNSTLLKFDLDTNYINKIEFKLPDKTAYVDEIQNNEFLIIPGLLAKDGRMYFTVAQYDSNSRLTNVANGIIDIVPELVNVDDIIELDDRLPILDDLISGYSSAIEQVDNLDLDVEKVDTTATITVKKKDGTTKIATITDGTDGIDGIGLDYDWDNTSLGIKRENEEEYEYVDLKGEKGDCNFATFDIEDGDLIMNKDDDMNIDFVINQGNLVVII